MSEILTPYYLYLAAFLFSAGIFVTITKRNAIFVLIGIELMLNSVNLVLATFSRYDVHQNGQILAIFVAVMAVCEVSVALAILLNIFKKMKTSDVSEMNQINPF